MFEKVKTREKNAFSGHLGALVAQQSPSPRSLVHCGVSGDVDLGLSVSPSTIGLDYITMHSLTHLLLPS